MSDPDLESFVPASDQLDRISRSRHLPAVFVVALRLLDFGTGVRQTMMAARLRPAVAAIHYLADVLDCPRCRGFPEEFAVRKPIAMILTAVKPTLEQQWPECPLRLRR